MKNKVQFLCVVNKKNELQLCVAYKDIAEMKYIIYGICNYSNEIWPASIQNYNLYIVKPNEPSPFYYNISEYNLKSGYHSFIDKNYEDIKIGFEYNKKRGTLDSYIYLTKRKKRRYSKHIIMLKVTSKQVEFMKKGCKIKVGQSFHLFDMDEFYTIYKSANNVKWKLLGLPYVGSILSIENEFDLKATQIEVGLPDYKESDILYYKQLFPNFLYSYLEFDEEERKVVYMIKDKKLNSLQECFIEFQKQEQYYKEIKEKECEI